MSAEPAPGERIDPGATQRDRGGAATSSGAGPAFIPLSLALDTQLEPQSYAIGKVLAGKYRVESVIGRGSMGVVVAATHLGFDELVAIKFIRPEMRQVEGIVSRFAREAKASIRIRNQHAVNVLDVGVADPIGPFFVMEYLRGRDLEELIDMRGPLDVATASQYVLQACEALAAAHAQGIIHRDIKPQNMFLARQGQLELLKLLDLGISKAALTGEMFGDDLSTSEKDWVMGTPLYMSPEQLRNAPDVDQRTDIWSLGAVLYELLSGAPPFVGDTQTEVCRQVFASANAPLTVALEGVPPQLCQVITRCLMQDREERFSNVAELACALLPFAPASSRLHVERAISLLAPTPIRISESWFGEVEVEGEPLDEPEEVAPPPSPPHVPPPSPPSRKAPRWLQSLSPAIVGLVAVLGFHRCSSNELSTAPGSDSDPPPSTERLALQPRPDCPVVASAPAPAAPPEVADVSAPTQAEQPEPRTAPAPLLSGSAAARRTPLAVNPAPSAAAEPAASPAGASPARAPALPASERAEASAARAADLARASAPEPQSLPAPSSATPSRDSALAAAPASAAPPAASSAAADATPAATSANGDMSAPAQGTPTPGAPAASGSPRQRSALKSKTPARPTFRLIGEPGPSHFALLPPSDESATHMAIVPAP